MKLTLLRWGGLSTKKFQPKRPNKESSLERRYFVWQGLTDLLYANGKDLIQGRRIKIRVASLSLVSFRHSSVLSLRQLTSYILYISSFSLQLVMGWSFVFGGEIWHFQVWRWMNLDLTKYFAEDRIRY